MIRKLMLAAALAAGQASAADAPVRVILVGDSTMAPETGYGDALCAGFTPAVRCLNLARGGRSTMSYRAEGLWDNVQALLREPGYARTYVLIQFGHNDQPGKPGRSTDLVSGFTPNMARYVQDVRAQGGVPVLLTPLTRRTFRERVLQNDLRPWADATLTVAREQGATALDLNAESYMAVQLMGEQEADTLAMAPPPAAPLPSAPAAAVEPAGAPKRGFDRTHVGAKGAAYFARMVQRELVLAVPALATYTRSAP
jgi:lysophospholipase L1-like esterase